MEVLIKLNPAEAMAAIETGAFKFILEAAHAAQDQAEKVIRTAQTYEEPKQGAQPGQQQPNQPVNNQQPQGQYSSVPVTQPDQAQNLQIVYNPATPPVGSIPTSAQTYSMEQLAVAATQLVDAGRRMDLVNLLNSFGVQALTALPKEQYGAFATQLRAMGAKI